MPRKPLSAPALAATLWLALGGGSAQAFTAPAPTVPRPPMQQWSLARHAMVAAAEPDAVEAGLKVLRAGGSAVDAAVAVQAVLGLEEPQSSGLGGGAFVTYYDARTRAVIAYNGREVAPQGATPDMFLGPDGKPLPFIQAVLSGRSTGVPGAIAALALAQREHGRKAWASLFADAIRLADQGFKVTPRLGWYISSRFPQAHTPDASAYFTKPDGTRYQAGEVLKNPAYAASLRKIAAEGVEGLLGGRIAADIVAKTHEEPRPGTLQLSDLSAYRARETRALCRPYRAYIVCAPPAPSGGPGLLELLGILEHTDIARRGPDDPQAWVTFAGASRLMYADRDYYEGDPRFVRVPVRGMLDPAYDAARAKLIATLGPEAPAAGDPPGAPPAGPDRTVEPGGTSDIAIADAEGNVVSITTTVESIFGSGRMTDGFFLNNQLTDFSFTPTQPNGAPAANAVGPGKQPRSSMSPAIILDRRGRFFAAAGSPGGNSIIAYVAKAIVGLIDWKLTPADAVALPNIVARGAVISVEGSADPRIVQALQAKGLNVRPDAGEDSGLMAVELTPHGLEGAADPRREGVARGY